MTKTINLTLVAFLLIALLVPMVSAQNGPVMEILRFKVIKSPDAKLLGTQTEITDVWPSMSVPMDVYSSILGEANGGPMTGDLQKLDGDGFTIVEDLPFHVAYICFNIRDTSTIQSYYRPGISYWPLHDVEFRHALVHCYDQLGIIPPIYGYTVDPIRSLVTYAQSKYYNPAVPEHPYNPGNPFTSVSGDGSSCGMLMAAGYTFQDLGATGVVDDADYWKCPGGADMPYLEILIPLAGVAPTSWQHVQEFVKDLNAIGLAATTANGNKGLLGVGTDFTEYLSHVYDSAEFDACMVCTNFGRVPEQLYTLLHSNQDSLIYPGRRNAPGVDDTAVDTLCETVKLNLDTDNIEVAAKELQEMMYTPDTSIYPNADNFALAYMCMHSRRHYGIFHPHLEGIVRSTGYGADNKWTFLNIKWKPGYEQIEAGKTIVYWILGDEPSSLNALYAGTKYEWEITARTHDGLTNVNPYNHYDIPWLASDWTITKTVDGMDVDFTLRSDVEWQDGHPFVAGNVEFCLEFIRDHNVPRYANPCQHIDDVIVTDSTHLTIESDEEGIALFYEFAGLSAMLPPQIWDRTWASDQAVLDYDPSSEPYNTAPGYTAGPNPPDTNLFGTGPWVYKFYDTLNMYADLWKNENYFMSTAAIDTLKTGMFWEVGDYNTDGIVNVIDLTFVGFAFGCINGLDPCYDADADFDSDDIVDTRDIYIAAYHLLWQKEYP